jgi:hypothetical protein
MISAPRYPAELPFHQLTTFNVDEDELKVKSAPVEFRSIS